MDDYRVELEVFSGPLDLLLHLVKKNEVDIFDIPIAKITDQYLAYLELMRLINMDVAADFLVTASTLMEIKSRLLLPRLEPLEGEEEAEEDPRAELVRQLLEYKRLKEAARLLDERARLQEDLFQRLSHDRPPEETLPPEEILGHVELWDLLDAFGQLMRATAALGPRHIVYDDTPIQTYKDRLLERLRRCGRLAFWDLFEDRSHRWAIIGMFLAVLELMKDRLIRADQLRTHGDIYIELAPEEPEPSPPGLPEPPAETVPEPPPTTATAGGEPVGTVVGVATAVGAGPVRASPAPAVAIFEPGVRPVAAAPALEPIAPADPLAPAEPDEPAGRIVAHLLAEGSADDRLDAQ